VLEGQFPVDRVATDTVGSGLCPEQRPVPAFGAAAMLPRGGVDLLLLTLGDFLSRINKQISLEWWVAVIGLRPCVFVEMLLK
jgi:hypothetical protein